MIPKFQSKSTVKKVAPEARAAVLADSKRLPKPAPGSASEEDSSSAEDGDEADTEIAVTKASAGAAAPTVNDRTLHCYKWEEALLEEVCMVLLCLLFVNETCCDVRCR